MARYPSRYPCKDCGRSDLIWDDRVRSERTGKKIPLNPDGTKHYLTCEARADPSSAAAEQNHELEEQQQQQQQQQQEEIIKPPSTSTIGNNNNNNSSSSSYQNQQIFDRLDRIDTTVRSLAELVARIKVGLDGIDDYFRRKQKEEEANSRMAWDEAAYDQDKEDGLV
jgi:hypothetical protein